MYEEAVSLSIRINCRWRRETPATNETPMDRGVSSLDWGWKCLGIDFTDSRMWQEEDTWSMASSTFRAKKHRLKRRFVWYFEG